MSNRACWNCVYHGVVLLFVLGLQAVRHARIMSRCGLKQVCCSNPIPTSDSGQSSLRLWFSNPYSLSLTRQSNMHFNDNGWMNGYIGNDNRERNKQRTDTGAPISHTGTLSYLACEMRDLILLYQNKPRYHYPAAWEFATARGTEHLQSSLPKVLSLSILRSWTSDPEHRKYQSISLGTTSPRWDMVLCDTMVH